MELVILKIFFVKTNGYTDNASYYYPSYINFEFLMFNKKSSRYIIYGHFKSNFLLLYILVI
jgi:hypothetical protein